MSAAEDRSVCLLCSNIFHLCLGLASEGEEEKGGTEDSSSLPIDHHASRREYNATRDSSSNNSTKGNFPSPAQGILGRFGHTQPANWSLLETPSVNSCLRPC